MTKETEEKTSAEQTFGVTLPEGQEADYITTVIVEQAKQINGLQQAVQGMVNHVGTLTEQLVIIQNELRAAIQHNKGAFEGLEVRVDDLHKTVEAFRKEGSF